MQKLGFTIAHVAAMVSALSGVVACTDAPMALTTPGCPADPVDGSGPSMVTADEACSLAAQTPIGSLAAGNHSVICPPSCPTQSCEIDSAYASAFVALNPDGGVATVPDASDVDGGDGGGSADADAGRTAVCPATQGNVQIECLQYCSGRRTEGVLERSTSVSTSGEYYAACAYLEAVSVIAFARLREELAAHGAPRELLSRVERARIEEIRHTELTTMLARRCGVEPGLPPDDALLKTRSLYEVALENAIEGCIRETYGAAFAMVRADRAIDPVARAAEREIAVDETSHAELAWDIAAWASTRLGDEERAQIRCAMRDATQKLSRDVAATTPSVDPSAPSARECAALVRLLDEQVFRMDPRDVAAA